MKNEEIKNQILICFQNIGIHLLEYKNEIKFSNLVNDSLTFISLMIEIENCFQKEIPSNFMTLDAFDTLKDIFDMVCLMLDNNI